MGELTGQGHSETGTGSVRRRAEAVDTGMLCNGEPAALCPVISQSDEASSTDLRQWVGTRTSLILAVLAVITSAC